MARAVTVLVPSAQTVSYTLDQDTNVVGFSSTIETSLSRDAVDTYQTLNAGLLAVTKKTSPIAFVKTGYRPGGVIPAIPLLEGEVIYVNFSAAGSAIIYLEP
jgi:hypothetical protein